MPPQNQFELQSTGQPVSSAQPMHPLPKEKPHLGLIIGLVIACFLLILTCVFGFWAYQQMLDYKLNSDDKSAVAVKKAEEEKTKVLEAQFAEQEKSPLKSYTSPSQYGTVKLVYPKTWSAYIIEQTTSGSGTPVEGYFYPNFVPNVGAADKTNYSLRIQIVNSSYKTVLDSFKQQVTTGKLSAIPYSADLVKGVAAGTRLDGQIQQNKKGSMVVLPLRDKVLKIWTENDTNAKDFNDFILKNLTYVP